MDNRLLNIIVGSQQKRRPVRLTSAENDVIHNDVITIHGVLPAREALSDPGLEVDAALAAAGAVGIAGGPAESWGATRAAAGFTQVEEG